MRYWRELRGLSVQELAQRVGKDRRTISSAEDGRDIPSEAIVHRIEAVLATEGLLISRYEALLAEKRRSRFNRDAGLLESSPHAARDDASIFLHETIPDGTLMRPGERFVKEWTIQNTGKVIWQDRYLTRIGISAGSGLITTPARILIEVTPPGAEVTIAVPCVAQFVEGTSLAVFKMTDERGRLFFPGRYSAGLQVQVTVIR